MTQCEMLAQNSKDAHFPCLHLTKHLTKRHTAPKVLSEILILISLDQLFCFLN
jgi:hypothetical protein